MEELPKINTITKPQKVKLPNGSEYVIEELFVYKKFPCVIVLYKMGHRCGYAGIPNFHPLYGKTWDNIEIKNLEVHGGITYNEQADQFPIPSTNGYWLGFDCAHAGDKKDFESAYKYWNDKHLDLLKEMEERFSTSGTIRTQEFVKEELIKLIEQLENMLTKEIPNES